MLSLALLLAREPESLVLGYILPVSHQSKKTPCHSNLYSSPNTISGLTLTSRDDDDDDDDDDKDDRDKNRRSEERKKMEKPQSRIEFSNFWGTKYAADDESNDPRNVPFVPSLDPHDGPLPPGAYMLEGKPEFDAKPTCRITVSVRSGNVDRNIADDPDEVVRKLQTCLDAGFDTFQLHDQSSRSLDIVRRMNEDTPSYIQKHWSVSIRAASMMPSSPDDFANNGSSSGKSDLRHSVLDLIEQTGSDALDSLQIDCTNAHIKTSYDMTLELFEHLVDLQREGWIRSIGLRGTESSPRLQHDIMNYFGENIDFHQEEGSLMVPPSFSSGGLFLPKKQNANVRMSNALAGGLLTDLYNSDKYRRLGKYGSRHAPQAKPRAPLLTNENMKLLNQWASRRKLEQGSTNSNLPVLKQYQEHIVDQLSWIAMKHDVSITAVALRWALQCGGCIVGKSAKKNLENSVIISSAIADVVFDGPSTNDLPFRKPTELRQVFRFQLDEEDTAILSEIASIESEEDEDEDEANGDYDYDYDYDFNNQDGGGYPKIDFDNPKFWL